MATADNSLASPAETSSAADVVIDVSGSGFASIQDEWVAEPGVSELCLMFNAIERIEKLDGLTSLRKLNLRANRIAEMRGLGSLSQLAELELYENRIERIEGLEGLEALTMLAPQGLILRPYYRMQWQPLCLI